MVSQLNLNPNFQYKYVTVGKSLKFSNCISRTEIVEWLCILSYGLPDVFKLLVKLKVNCICQFLFTFILNQSFANDLSLNTRPVQCYEDRKTPSLPLEFQGKQNLQWTTRKINSYLKQKELSDSLTCTQLYSIYVYLPNLHVSCMCTVIYLS